MTSVEDIPLRILIADDEALVRGGFRVLIDAEPGVGSTAWPRPARSLPTPTWPVSTSSSSPRSTMTRT